MTFKISSNVESSIVSEFNIKNNGIQIVDSANQIEIYNDPFRTVPLFVYSGKNNDLYIFSNFEEFYELEGVDKNIDEVGFWEIILFGGGLWTRTLYTYVKQMPSATKIIIDKGTSQYKIERYWDFNVIEDKSIDSLEKAAKGLYVILDNIFSSLNREDKYVMGMSGGMDSRITLAFLSKYIPKEKVELFTYGFDERLLEYKYACEIAKALGYEKPEFHKLTAGSYRYALSYLPKMSGGQVGINHCHILDYLQTRDASGCRQISTYYSDAIFGWDSSYPKSVKNVAENFYIEAINDIDFLSEDIKEFIRNDSLNIFEGMDSGANFSSLNEYKYVTERNQKFHMYMASIQDRYIGNEMIYADYDLLVYFLSVPLVYREQKRMIDYLFDHYFESVHSGKIRNISSRVLRGGVNSFQWGGAATRLIGYYSFKLLNRVNAILRPITKGRVQIFNKFQTEEQDRLLHKNFHEDLKGATNKCVELGLMSNAQKREWDKLPLRSTGIGERYAFIGLGKLLNL